ncbi:hypothetical protein NQZ68_018702 [Dissostichus eleginoides]|nr:hypothetical protein NQZ68_018702 [Dissostichus eleginoides]
MKASYGFILNVRPAVPSELRTEESSAAIGKYFRADDVSSHRLLPSCCWTGQRGHRLRSPEHYSTPMPAAMLPCLRTVLRPALSLRAGSALATAGLSSHLSPAIASCARSTSEPALSMLGQRRHLGTHPLRENVDPLDSPRGAKEFIYTLHPTERSCLLRELHKFESIAIAQGYSM